MEFERLIQVLIEFAVGALPSSDFQALLFDSAALEKALGESYDTFIASDFTDLGEVADRRNEVASLLRLSSKEFAALKLRSLCLRMRDGEVLPAQVDRFIYDADLGTEHPAHDLKVAFVEAEHLPGTVTARDLAAAASNYCDDVRPLLEEVIRRTAYLQSSQT